MPDLIPLVMEAGQLLHGRAWMAPLARDLSVSDRTLQRWMAGAAEVPAGVRAELAALVRQHLSRAREVAALLDSAPQQEDRADD